MMLWMVRLAGLAPTLGESQHEPDRREISWTESPFDL